MNSELKAKWIAALRSGKYKQGRSVLRTADNKYCCLGVLCEVAGLNWQKEPGSPYFCEAGQDYIENAEIMEQLGLNYDDHRACYSLNDGTFDKHEINDWNGEQRPHTFAEIADWLEKRL